MRREPCRTLSTTLLGALGLEDRRAVTCYYECLAHDGRLGGGENAETILAMAIVFGSTMAIPERFWTHRCCQCERTGAVVPLGGAGPSLPIEWRCQGCDRLVCHGCTLTVPGSVPLRFREETLCSEACWRKIGAPREEEEQEGSWLGARGSGKKRRRPKGVGGK